MRKFLFFIPFLATCAFAETIGNVEYKFPGSLADWELINEIQEEEITGFLYSHVTDEGAEFFGVNADHEQPSLPTEQLIREGLQLAYPEQKIAVSIWDSSPQSILFEWSISDNSQAIIQGLGRVFSTEKGNVALTYIGDPNNQQRSNWIKVLKEAKLIE